MTPRCFRAQKQRVQALAAKWLKPLGLLWWQVDIYYYDKRKEWCKGHGQNAVMSTLADWRYRKARIDVQVPLLADLAERDLERIFVHECMHILVNEMQQPGDDRHDHEERVCETLAEAFQWVRSAPEE